MEMPGRNKKGAIFMTLKGYKNLTIDEVEVIQRKWLHKFKVIKLKMTNNWYKFYVFVIIYLLLNVKDVLASINAVYTLYFSLGNDYAIFKISLYCHEITQRQIVIHIKCVNGVWRNLHLIYKRLKLFTLCNFNVNTSTY